MSGTGTNAVLPAVAMSWLGLQWSGPSSILADLPLDPAPAGCHPSLTVCQVAWPWCRHVFLTHQGHSRRLHTVAQHVDDGALHAQGLVAVATMPMTVACMALAWAMGFMAVDLATAGMPCAFRVAVTGMAAAMTTCSAMECSANAACHCNYDCASFTP